MDDLGQLVVELLPDLPGEERDAFEEALDASGQILAAASILFGLLTPGALVEGRRWAVAVEWLRLGLLIPLAAWIARGSPVQIGVVAGVSAAALGLAIWIRIYRSRRPEEAISLPLDRSPLTTSTASTASTASATVT